MDFLPDSIEHHEPPDPPERLTEELQRQEWQERIANLELNLEALRWKMEDEQLAELAREEREGITGPEYYPPSSLHLVRELPNGGPLIHSVAPPLLRRIPPEKLEALLEEWRRLHHGLGK